MAPNQPDRVIGVIGLGRMGSALANRILDAGFSLTIHNRSKGKATSLLAKGATWAETPRVVAAASDIVITCLMDDHSVEQVVSGPDGVLLGLRKNAIHLCATTISPMQSNALAKAHSERESIYIAGPVLGRPAAAAAGQLVTLVCGPEEGIARCRAVMATYAARIVPLGSSPGVANQAKLLANYIAYSVLELIGQVHAFAERGGIPSGFITEMLDGAFAHPAMREYNQRIAERRYDSVGFDTRAGLKDLDLIQTTTTEIAAPLAFTGIVRDRFLAAIANGGAEKDMCVIAEISRSLCGLPISLERAK